MSDEDMSLTEALGIDGTGSADDAKKPSEIEGIHAKLSSFEGGLTENRQAISQLTSSIAALNQAIAAIRPESQKTVDQADKAAQKAKASYDQLINLGIKPGEVEGVSKIIDYYMGDKLQEVDNLKSRLSQYEGQFNQISNTAVTTAISSAISALETEAQFNSADSPLTFKEWKEEVLIPTLNNPNLSNVVRQTLAQNPYQTLKSLYLENLGEAVSSPDKMNKRKEARGKADERKKDATIPKGSGTGLKAPERKVESTNVSDRMSQSLLGKVRV